MQHHDQEVARLVEERMAEPDFDFASELCRGAREIAQAHGLTERAARRKIEKGEVPTFRWGGMLCTFRSLTPRLIAARFRRGLDGTE